MPDPIGDAYAKLNKQPANPARELGTIEAIFEGYPKDNPDYDEVQRIYVTLSEILKIPYKISLSGGLLLKIYLGLPLLKSDIDIYPYNLYSSSDIIKIVALIEKKLGIKQTENSTTSDYAADVRIFNFSNKFYERNFQMNFTYCGSTKPDFVNYFDFRCCRIYTEDGKVWAASQIAKDNMNDRILYWNSKSIGLERLCKYYKLGFRVDPTLQVRIGMYMMDSVFMLKYGHGLPDINYVSVAGTDRLTLMRAANNILTIKNEFKEILHQNTGN